MSQETYYPASVEEVKLLIEALEYLWFGLTALAKNLDDPNSSLLETRLNAEIILKRLTLWLQKPRK